MYTDEFMEALAVLYLHPADFCPLATRKSYICTRLVSLLVALDCNGHFEAVLESEGVMCWILWDCFGTLSLLSLAIQKLAQQKGAKRLWLTLQSSNQKQTLMYGILVIQNFHAGNLNTFVTISSLVTDTCIDCYRLLNFNVLLYLPDNSRKWVTNNIK